MTDLSTQQMESTASWYQKLLVPALFEPWTSLVLHEVQLNATDRLLDVACGTGVLARAAANKLSTEGQVAGLDINLGMLRVAESLSPNIEWHKGIAEDLPWQDHTFDAVVCQFGLMFFENREQALKEMYRVLKPGGPLVVTAFDSLDHISGYERIIKVYAKVAGEAIAKALQFPFSFGDVEELEALCAACGITSSGIITHEAEARFPDLITMVLADVKGWFPLAGITLEQKKINQIVSQSEMELKDFIAPDGSVKFTVSAHFIAALKN
ncbi:methyltransferase domain-containing protein [Fodinibius salsisoli]|uniref:Methyltransferase domain-containing protein n=1 Tax=Fodinibius salsisoli TaxID=2820877 RepID=A0ABT3PJJ9_9BACT|nr:methyltransferase domain-containing protein [Fodinibius salsisoli]MCW9706128.1 methyltransferase domain-containing protein [Fodinibius salsisoli]